MAGGRHPIDHKDHRLRKDFSRSTLVRLLGDWAPVPAPDVRQDFAQRLSQWVGVADAITLLNRGRSLGTYRKGEISREKVLEMMAGGKELVDLEAELAAMNQQAPTEQLGA